VFGGHWVSNEIWEDALLPTVRAEALPLLAPPILLGVVLPELGSLGGGEKMVTNWLLGGRDGSRMTSQEAILKSYNYKLQAKNGFFRGASSGCRGTRKKISPIGL